jgi:hypothetical protein
MKNIFIIVHKNILNNFIKRFFVLKKNYILASNKKRNFPIKKNRMNKNYFSTKNFSLCIVIKNIFVIINKA